MWLSPLNFGAFDTVTINRTLSISLIDEDLILSKTDVLWSLGNFSKLRRQCFSRVIWKDIFAFLIGQLDIVLFCLFIKVHSSYLFTVLCSQEVRSTCITQATKVPLLPEVKRVPREIEAKYLFPCLPPFQASGW